MPKLSEKCIFCERNEKLHKEHIFSRWISDILGRPNITHQRAMIQGSRNNPRIRGILQDKKHPGGVISVQLKVVCQRHCNGGWMNSMETQVKPYLGPLILGQAAVLNEESQTKIARWFAMKVMTAEFEKPSLVCSTQSDRTFIMSNNRPPKNWQVFIGDHRSRKWRTSYSRNSGTLWVGSAPEFPTDTSQAHNTQVITMGIGFVLIHAISTTLDDLKIEAGSFTKRAMHQIWPYKRGLLWPSLPILSDRDADLIDSSFNNAITAPGFRWVATAPPEGGQSAT
jgi:hypothetical protein